MCLRPRPCSAFSGCLPSYKYRLLGQIPRINHRELICSLLTASLQFPYSFLTVSLQSPLLAFPSFLAGESHCELYACASSMRLKRPRCGGYVSNKQRGLRNKQHGTGESLEARPTCTHTNKLLQKMFKHRYGRNM